MLKTLVKDGSICFGFLLRMETCYASLLVLSAIVFLSNGSDLLMKMN